MLHQRQNVTPLSPLTNDGRITMVTKTALAIGATFTIDAAAVITPFVAVTPNAQTNVMLVARASVAVNGVGVLTAF